MGVVYLATDGSKSAAVKTVHPQLLHEPGFRQRFAREADAVRSVSSPRVAQLLEAQLNADPAFLAFAYIEGPTLASRIARYGPLEGDELVAFAAALADGLAGIHAAGVTHRDIKPSNLICRPDGPVIIDFGVAVVAEATSLTGTGLTIGSVGWMAPEQASGRALGPSCDLFSWAATVAFAASGEPPFGTGRSDAVIYRILHEEPSVPALPDKLDSLVRAALSKTPDERPTAREVLEALVDGDITSVGADDQVTHLLERSWTMPMEATPNAATSIAPQPARVKRRAVAAATAAAVVLAVAAGVALTANDKGNPVDDTEFAADVGQEAAAVTSTTASPTSPTVPAPTTTATPVDLRSVDWRNRTYELDCSGLELEQVTLVDGRWSMGEPAMGDPFVDGVDVIYMDITPEPGEEAAVSISCVFGAHTVMTHTFIYRPVGDEVAQVGPTVYGYPVLASDLVVGGLDVYNPVYFEGSPLCCPDAYERETWAWRNGTLSEVMTRQIDVDELPDVEFSD